MKVIDVLIERLGPDLPLPSDAKDYEVASDYFLAEREVEIEDLPFWQHWCDGYNRVLEIGCGGGTLARSLRSTNSVIGLDLSHSLLLRARATDELVVRASAHSLPVRSEAFDAAILPKGLLSYALDLRQRIRIVAECARILKPHGRIVVDVPRLDVGRDPHSQSGLWFFNRRIMLSDGHWLDVHSCTSMPSPDVVQIDSVYERFASSGQSVARLAVRHRHCKLSAAEVSLMLVMNGFEVTDVRHGYAVVGPSEGDRIVVVGRKVGM